MLMGRAGGKEGDEDTAGGDDQPCSASGYMGGGAGGC